MLDPHKDEPGGTGLGLDRSQSISLEAPTRYSRQGEGDARQGEGGSAAEEEGPAEEEGRRARPRPREQVQEA